MRYSISETARLAGVSVRTLHYYDEIGLLSPSEVISETGYRYYDNQALERLQQILFYRELDFPLKEIVKIMNTSEYNKEYALKRQRELLVMKKNRLEKLISLLDANVEGKQIMNFKEFDMQEIEEAKKKYAKEVEEKWGNTKSYTQCQEKQKNYKKEDWAKMKESLDSLLKEFGKYVGESPESEEVQNLVTQWQQFITDTSYECTNEILAGLGKMYVADERFKNNMDQFQEGTAQLISDAIKYYVKK